MTSHFQRSFCFQNRTVIMLNIIVKFTLRWHTQQYSPTRVTHKNMIITISSPVQSDLWI